MKPSDGASNLLAGSKQRGYAARMRTQHLRNVPDDVMERLERMARAAGTSIPRRNSCRSTTSSPVPAPG